MRIRVDLGRQCLELFGTDGACIRRYAVSTGERGAGERSGSLCTPRGRHRIRARIGAGAPAGAVFRGRRPTGEVWSREFAAAHPGCDWILSRILWLSGTEPGEGGRTRGDLRAKGSALRHSGVLSVRSSA